MRVGFEEVRSTLTRVLLTRQCSLELAEEVGFVMATNSLDGTYTHGVNRFPGLIGSIDDGLVQVNRRPIRKKQAGAMENYDGCLGLGVTNASFCMERAIFLARDYGIGLIALANTNHWMRAATYGYQACQAGMVGICFTNTAPNMPTWGGADPRLGNNPLMLAFPHSSGDIVVDMAMSQFSYGALQLAALEGRQMSADAGFNRAGELTCDPHEVLETKRILPAGYWKGAALSFILDIIAAGLSEGNSTAVIGEFVSQVFIAIDLWKMMSQDAVEEMVDHAVKNLLDSKPITDGQPIIVPGRRRAQIREENLRKGIPVDERIWETILGLLEP
jgi:3-dehydro-L-gulonate 2-dehydrogenase